MPLIPSETDQNKFSDQFTPRETEVIEHFAEGYSSASTAIKLNISEGTVRAHRKNILQKSGCRNITHAVALWAREIH
ncbi:MAG: helix-turn-helix transcriptional regulator [Cyclobacteriaceae bacterium]